jgi:hypothetical protein
MFIVGDSDEYKRCVKYAEGGGAGYVKLIVCSAEMFV